MNFYQPAGSTECRGWWGQHGGEKTHEQLANDKRHRHELLKNLARGDVRMKTLSTIARDPFIKING